MEDKEYKLDSSRSDESREDIKNILKKIAEVSFCGVCLRVGVLL